MITSLMFAGLLACATNSASQASSAAPTTQTVYRTWSAVDEEFASRRLGRLAIVVRSADLPMQAVGYATLTLTSPTLVGERRVVADSLGVVRLDSLPSGPYSVQVTRIGYATGRVPVPVEAGCRSVLEVYVGMRAIGIDPPSPMPTRSTATLCQRRP